MYLFHNGTIYTWTEGGKVVNVGRQFLTYITHDTILSATEYNGEPVSGKSNVVPTGYELSYNSSGVHKITCNFYVQDFFYWSYMGAYSEFLGGGTIFRSLPLQDGDTTSTEVDAELLSDPVLVSVANSQDFEDGTGGVGGQIDEVDDF